MLIRRGQFIKNIPIHDMTPSPDNSLNLITRSPNETPELLDNDVLNTRSSQRKRLHY